MINQRMANTCKISVTGVDLTTVTNPELYIKQGDVFLKYDISDIEIYSDSAIIVRIPKSDAMQLSGSKPVKVQLAFTRPGGNPDATKVTNASVKELLSEAGYGE